MTTQSLFSAEDLQTKPLELRFAQAGDPWHDWGLCELHEALQNIAAQETRLQVLAADASGFTLRAAMDEEELARLIHDEMASSARWNMLHPRFEEGRKISGCEPRIVDGRRVTGEKNDAKLIKENWQLSECANKPPQQARNKCQRISNVPLVPNVLANLMAVDGGAKAIEHLVLDAVAAKNSDLKQEANPLAANHHSNGKVRGPHASNAARVAEGQFVLSCYFASLSPHKPFVTVPPSSCTVYLPDNVPFDRALRLWKQLRFNVLRHPDDSGGTMYRNLPLNGDGEAMQLLVLLDALQRTVPVTRESDDLNAEEVVELNNWLAISFSSGTGVAVGSVHRIEVPSKVFALIAPIAPPERFKNQSNVAFVPDCLSGIRVSDATPQTYFARALMMSAASDRWRAIEDAVFFLYKNVGRANTSNRYSASLLSHFCTHFAKEMNLMENEQLEACRRIGTLAGQAFNRDVTMISRLHNISSPEQLRENLALLSFRLFKASNGSEEDRHNLRQIKLEQFERVLSMAAGPDWEKAAQTISLFACLNAFNKNLGDKSDAQKSAAPATT